MNNIFVGNLSFDATKEDVEKLFKTFGTVARVVIKEKRKGKSRGFGFVDMPHEEEKNAAMAALEGKEFMGRPLSIRNILPKGEYKPKKLEKPWVKKDAESKPWVKKGPETKPWKKSSFKPGGTKAPYKKFESSSKPWEKREGAPSEGASKAPFKKFARPSSKPFRKPGSTSKPWPKKKVL
jgi:RNA recognition motif-containing protein